MRRGERWREDYSSGSAEEENLRLGGTGRGAGGNGGARRQAVRAHPEEMLAIACPGDVLRREGRSAESEATLRWAPAVLVQAGGESGGRTPWTLEAFVNLYTAWGKLARASEYAARLAPPS